VSRAWPVLHHHEPAAAFHGRSIPDPATRHLWVCEPTGPSLVLGSAQRDDLVDRAACAAAGTEVVRRRSGGGAVLVEPGALLWVDVILPTDDPLWELDVGRAFLWLGDVWSAALADLGRATAVHRGALLRSPWSDLVCFAGLGPGELTDETGAKVLGISQRRTRGAARFQCAALLHPWDPTPLLGLLAVPADRRAAAECDLHHAAAGLAVDAADLLAAFVTRLP
jgi:lipoate-protein ligase A